MRILRKYFSRKSQKEIDKIQNKKSSKSFSKTSDITKRVVKTGIKSGKKYIKEFDKDDYDKIMAVKHTFLPEDKQKDNKKSKLFNKQFSGRDKVPAAILKKAKTEGVVQKDSKGRWRIVSIKAGEFWDAVYDTKQSAQNALAAYHANRH